VSDNLVRDIHDLVATSADPSQASARPPGTTRRELRAMRRDVLDKLRLTRGMSVAEIGCGICLLGAPVARQASRYVGLDFAPQAVRVANERLRAAGLGDRAQALCLDVLNLADDELQRLGRFDRVLMYAVLHYARTEQEAVRLLQRAVDLLAPGGMALVGNVPLEDMAAGWTAQEQQPRGPLSRLVLAGGWCANGGVAAPLTLRWKTRRTFEAVVKAASLRAASLKVASLGAGLGTVGVGTADRRARFGATGLGAARSKAASLKAGTSPSAHASQPARLPANYTLALSTVAVERWLAMLDVDVTYHWQLPAPGVPLAPGRADLLILRR
jgi:SAM-dependent methyltransferase